MFVYTMANSLSHSVFQYGLVLIIPYLKFSTTFHIFVQQETSLQRLKLSCSLCVSVSVCTVNWARWMSKTPTHCKSHFMCQLLSLFAQTVVELWPLFLCGNSNLISVSTLQKVLLVFIQPSRGLSVSRSDSGQRGGVHTPKKNERGISATTPDCSLMCPNDPMSKDRRRIKLIKFTSRN